MHCYEHTLIYDVSNIEEREREKEETKMPVTIIHTHS